MSIGELFGWGSILVAVLVAFVLGAAPVFAVRLIAAIYPKDHPRRRELIAESVHVKKGLLHIGEQWRWLGEMFGLAVVEGIPLRWRLTRSKRDTRLVWRTFSIVPGSTTHIRAMDRKLVFARRHGRTVMPIADAFGADREFLLVDAVISYAAMRVRGVRVRLVRVPRRPRRKAS